MMKSSGLLSEESNTQANEALTNAIEYMKSAEYQKTRDASDVIPTHKHLLPQQPKSTEPRFDAPPEGNHDNGSSAANNNGEVSDEEEEDDITAWRAKRAAELKRKVEQSAKHGGYAEVQEVDFFKSVVRDQGGSDCVVVHFYHPKFKTCEGMDKEISMLAPQMRSVKFIKVNVEKAPFLVDKLSVSVLPCLIFFRDDICIDRTIGFEECGGDQCNSEDLQKMILKKLRLD
eukprot:PhF_6_TR41599/c0_g1_i2/m.63042